MTTDNNKLVIYEPTEKEIDVPIGYYKLHDLLKTISQALCDASEFTYNVRIHSQQGKVYIESNGEYFHMQCNSNGLLQLLGFKNNSYSLNNMYMSEQFPTDMQYTDIYIKLFLDNKEIYKYTIVENEQNEHFYEHICIDMHTSFGKRHRQLFNTQFDLHSVLNVNNVTIQLSQKSSFKAIFGCEWTH